MGENRNPITELGISLDMFSLGIGCNVQLVKANPAPVMDLLHMDEDIIRIGPSLLLAILLHVVIGVHLALTRPKAIETSSVGVHRLVVQMAMAVIAAYLGSRGVPVILQPLNLYTQLISLRIQLPSLWNIQPI